jgi:hypothetical protein
MSSLSGTDGHEKKIEIAKEKKELADKAFQVSDVATGAPSAFTSPCECGVAQMPFGWANSPEVLP